MTGESIQGNDLDPADTNDAVLPLKLYDPDRCVPFAGGDSMTGIVQADALTLHWVTRPKAKPRK